MHGLLSHELEVGVPAEEVWEIYGSLQLAFLIDKFFHGVLEKVEVVEGNGDVGTILQVIFAPGKTGAGSYKEKYTKIDNQKRVKEIEVIEGGYLDLGFRLHRTRLEIIERDATTSLIRSSIEYEIAEEFAANASLATIDELAAIAQVMAKYLIKKKANEHKEISVFEQQI